MADTPNDQEPSLRKMLNPFIRQSLWTVKLKLVDRISAFGVFLTALACPVCFPMLAVVGSALGLGFLHPYEMKIMILFQILVGTSFLGNLISFLNHRKKLPLAVGLVSPLLIFMTLHLYFQHWLLYTGLFGLLVASILNFRAVRQSSICRS